MAAVMWYAHLAAQVVGLIWLLLGVVVAVVLFRLGRMRDPLAAGAGGDA